MARIKGGMNAKKKHNRVLKMAKGYRGARSKQYRVAKQSVMRALTSSYAGRKQRKRQFRQLWIARMGRKEWIFESDYSACGCGDHDLRPDGTRNIQTGCAVPADLYRTGNAVWGRWDLPDCI